MNSPRQQARIDRGFTLVEILVVIAILAVLAVAVVFTVGGSPRAADDVASIIEVAPATTPPFS